MTIPLADVPLGAISLRGLSRPGAGVMRRPEIGGWLRGSHRSRLHVPSRLGLRWRLGVRDRSAPGLLWPVPNPSAVSILSWEVLEVWSEWRAGVRPSTEEALDAAIFYAVNDAYLPVE